MQSIAEFFSSFISYYTFPFLVLFFSSSSEIMLLTSSKLKAISSPVSGAIIASRRRSACSLLSSSSIYNFWSFQPSPTTVKRMALISLTPSILCNYWRRVIGIANGSEVRWGRWIFSERKNPEYDFLREGSKAVGPVS